MAAPLTTVDVRTRPFHEGPDGTAATLPGAFPEPAEFEGHPVAEVAAEVEAMSASQAIAWALEHFGRELMFAISFQKTSSVVVEIAAKADPAARFFYLDTELL
ncbi:MAG: hypothetical protein ACR2G3_10345, partial [Solirubrobacterales bacterium]